MILCILQSWRLVYSTQSPPTARRSLLKDSSYKKRRKITPNKMSPLLTMLHNIVLRTNHSLSLCYPYSTLQHARRAVGGDWVLYNASILQPCTRFCFTCSIECQYINILIQIFSQPISIQDRWVSHHTPPASYNNHLTFIQPSG